MSEVVCFSSMAENSAVSSASRSSALAASRSQTMGQTTAFQRTNVATVARPSRAQPLVIRAAKRVSTGRSLVLSSTLVSVPGKEKEVIALCENLSKWVGESKVSSPLG